MYPHTFYVAVFVVITLWSPCKTASLSDSDKPDSNSSDSLHKNLIKDSAAYWKDQAQTFLKRQILRKPNTGVAKNVIFFVGDGMSTATLVAARIHLGQRHGDSGEDTELSFEKFPYVGLSKSYCVDKQTGESACTATAYLGGVKGNQNTVGVTNSVKLNDCEAMRNVSNHVFSIGRYSQIKNKRTGVVTTAHITEPTPAGVYGHTSNRDWKCDHDVMQDGKNPKDCSDLAVQLVHGETGKNLNVIFGGGRTKFLPFSVNDQDGKPGSRLDNRDLIDEWIQQKKNYKHAYVSDRDGLLKMADSAEYALGLFNSGAMDFNLERNKTKEPSLEEMIVKAIKLLSGSEEGFFLFVEGALIDDAHHKNRARFALDETIEFHKAVEAAVNMTDDKDTLIVVTADHSHALFLHGELDRGHDILGMSTDFAGDSLRYTTINYGSGPGYKPCENGLRYNISKDDLNDIKYSYPAAFPLPSSHHGGDDVTIYARGPWAHLFSSVMEQNVIPHIINFAACIGEGATVCDT